MATDTPAFPTDTETGLSKREYFAAKALVGICSRPTTSAPAGNWTACAEEAFKAADAMVIEAAKPPA